MKSRNLVVTSLIGVVLMGVVGMSALVIRAYRTPLGPTLPIGTPTPMVVSMQIVSTIETAVTPVPIPVIQQATVCGESSAWNILVLGSDAGDGDKGTDLTRIMRVDFLNRQVTVFAFPNDLWVDTNGLGLTNPTVNSAKLGTVFYEARVRSTKTNLNESMMDGTLATARMLVNNFSVGTDHYIAVDLNQIPVMVDVIGGVPINIPQTITDPYVGMVIPAGQQTLNGAQFVAYARVAPNADDFGRIQRNNLLLDALRVKLLDPIVWAKIPELYTRFDEVIATDLTPEQINHLSCLLKEVPSSAILQDQVKQEWTSPGTVKGSLLWDRTKVFNRLRELGLIQ